MLRSRLKAASPCDDEVPRLPRRYVAAGGHVSGAGAELPMGRHRERSEAISSRPHGRKVRSPRRDAPRDDEVPVLPRTAMLRSRRKAASPCDDEVPRLPRRYVAAGGHVSGAGAELPVGRHRERSEAISSRPHGRKVRSPRTATLRSRRKAASPRD